MKREVRISDYRVFVCLWARRDGSFIFFYSAHTQTRVDPYEFGLMFARRPIL